MNEIKLKYLLIYTFLVMYCDMVICNTNITRNETISENAAISNSNSSIPNIADNIHQINTTKSDTTKSNTNTKQKQNFKTIANSWLVFGQETRKTLRSCLKNVSSF